MVVKKTDELRDPIVNAFRKCKIPMNRSKLNEYAVQYVIERVGISEFSRFVEEKRMKIDEIENIYREIKGE